MIQLTTLNDSPNQETTVQLADGSVVTLRFIYRPSVQRWSVDVEHESIAPGGKIDGKGLCTHPNLLRQWRNTIPFGLSVISTDQQDPVSLQDFVSGRITVYVLDQSAGNTDVTDIEENVFGAYAP